MSSTYSSRPFQNGEAFLGAKIKKSLCLIAIGGLFSLMGIGQNASAATQVFGWNVESGTLANYFNYNVQDAATISTAKPHSGTKSIFYHPYDASSSGDLTVQVPWSFGNWSWQNSLTEIFVRWWWWIPSTIEGGGGGGKHSWRIKSGGGSSQNEIDSGLQSTPGKADIDLFNIPDGLDSMTTYHSIVTYPLNQWFQMAVYSKLNTPGVANGVLTIWFNGVQQYSSSTVLYRNTSGSIPGWDAVAIQTNFDGVTSNSYWYIDDIEIWNGIPANIGSVIPHMQPAQ